MIRILTWGLLALMATLPARAATDVVEVTSPGGITAWLVQETSIPMIAFNLHFEGGAALDPQDKLGATNMMVSLLEEGAGDLDSLGFATRREELATRLRFRAGRDGISVSATVLSEFRDESLALLGLALKQPSFAPEAITRARAQIFSNIRAAETSPNTIASRAFARRAFPDHPYSRSVDGTLETVAALTREDLAAAHTRSLALNQLTIGVVGDITPQDLGPVLDRLFSGLPEAGPTLPPPTAALDAAETIVIDFDAPQSVVSFGHSGIARDDPDFIAAYVANQILGAGGYGSRLTEEVREKRGLTYGISSYLSPARLGSVFAGSVSSANNRVAEAIEVLRAEWARMDRDGITEQELADAKRYLTGAYPLRFDGNGPIASILVGLQREDLPIDYIANRNGLIEALTLEEVNRVAARILKPEALRVVVVGRPEGVVATE